MHLDQIPHQTGTPLGVLQLLLDCGLFMSHSLPDLVTFEQFYGLGKDNNRDLDLLCKI